MVLIISCHILQGLNIRLAFWINVGVQLFFILSGYLYGMKKIDYVGKFYRNRIKKILIPFMIIELIILIIQKCRGVGYGLIFMMGALLGFGATQGNTPILSHTWFITYILICYLITPMLQKVFSGDNFKTNFIRFLMVTLFLHLLQFYFVVNVDTCWIICFVFGYFFTKCCKEDKQKHLMYYLALIGFIIIFPIAFILQEGVSVKLPNFINLYSIYFINYGHVFLGAMLFIVLYNTLKYIKIKKSRVIDFLDGQSYYIYLTHQIFILFDFSLLFLTKYLAVNILIILAAAFVSAIILKVISDLVLNLIGRIEKKVKKNE